MAVVWLISFVTKQCNNSMQNSQKGDLTASMKKRDPRRPPRSLSLMPSPDFIYRIKKFSSAAPRFGVYSLTLGCVLGVFFYECGKRFANLFISHKTDCCEERSISKHKDGRTNKGAPLIKADSLFLKSMEHERLFKIDNSSIINKNRYGKIQKMQS